MDWKLLIEPKSNYTIDFDSLIKGYLIEDKSSFSLYLKEIWNDLSLRNKDPSLGISKSTFSQVLFNK